MTLNNDRLRPFICLREHEIAVNVERRMIGVVDGQDLQRIV